jgi:hypothetical protein
MTPFQGVEALFATARAADNRTWRSLASRLVGDQEIAGSNPAVLTGDKRAEVQMGARLLSEQEGSGSTPGCPTLQGSRGQVAQTRLITA